MQRFVVFSASRDIINVLDVVQCIGGHHDRVGDIISALRGVLMHWGGGGGGEV